MSKLIIEGGYKLKGEVAISGSKHSAVSMIIGALLTDDPVVIHNIPDILDVKYACSYISELGRRVSWPKKNTVKISGRPFGLRVGHTSKKLRYSLLGMGIKLTRTGNANMFLPGGCALGDRLCNFSIDGLGAMGATIQNIDDVGIVGHTRLHGGVIDLPYPSVSATLSLLCAASLARGYTIIRNAAANPEVMDFVQFLRHMGALVDDTTPHTLRVTGVKKLHGCDYYIMNDRIETATLIIATAIAGGNVTLVGGNLLYLLAETEKLSIIGVMLTQVANGIRVKSASDYQPISISTSPYPGFHTDVQPLITALLAAVPGRSYVSEYINNDRFGYICGLRRMAAKIRLTNEDWLCPNGKHGQCIMIDGQNLYGAEVVAPDLRGGAALVLAALGAEGQTVINNIEQIDRGYERLDEKLHSLGADIKRVNSGTT